MAKPWSPPPPGFYHWRQSPPVSDDRTRWGWQMTTAHPVKGHRAGIAVPAHETATIKGTKERRDGQLARRFKLAGYELLEVDDRGAGWHGRKMWDLHFRRLRKRGFEYQWVIEGLEELEMITKDIGKLRYFLWQEMRDSQLRHERVYDHYEKPESNAVEAFGRAAAGLVAAHLDAQYMAPKVPIAERRQHLRKALAEIKARKAARHEVLARIAQRVGPQPPRPIEGLVVNGIRYVSPTA